MNFTMHLCAHINVNFKGKSTLKPALAEKPGVTLQNFGNHVCSCLCVCVDALRSSQQYFSQFRGSPIKCFCFVCFVALRPKSTAMVIAGRSVHLTTLFPGQA